MTADHFLLRFEAVLRSSRSYHARCLAHDDRTHFPLSIQGGGEAFF